MKPDSFITLGALAASLAWAASPLSAAADPIADFYKGKRMILYVASEPGGGYDTYGRLLARNMGKHIPGKPKFVVKNMPGAAGVRATNFVYNVAPQDGTVIGGTQRGVPFLQVLGNKGPQFKSEKINWIGSLMSEAGIIKVWTATSPVKTIQEAFTKTVVLGGTGPASDAEIYPALMNNLLGTKFAIISGYPSSTSIDLATERGEVFGQSRSFSSMVARYPDWRKKFTILVQLSLKKHPDLPNVPLIFDLVKTKEQDTMFRLMLTQKAMGRPYMLGPKVPAARVKALRKAFSDMVQDPDFKAAAKKQRRDLIPLSGDEVQAMINKVAAAPKDVIAKLKKAIIYHGEKKMAKVQMAKHTGKVTATKKGGRRIVIDFKGKNVTAKVSGSRTKVTINGKKAKRKAVKVGMTCTFTYPGAGQEATNVDCKG